MSKTITIKNQEIGKGMPIICVPVVGKTEEEILTQVRSLVDQGVKMIEWRIDCLENMQDTNVLRRMLLEISEICKDTIVLAAIRSTTQGGRAKLDEKAMKKLLLVIATSHAVDLLDVEYFFFKEEPKELIADLQKEGIKIVASHHSFQKTPSLTEMEMQLLAMEVGGADIVKLAVMPHNTADVFRLMEAASTFSLHEETPMIAMSMGKLGVISRVAGELLGNAVTFATVGEGSAPGQMPAEEVKTVMDTLHKYGVEE